MKKYRIGWIPHYVDKEKFWQQHGKLKSGELFIDIQTLDWKQFIDQIVQCDKIASSSLHGIIIAEAYGVPAIWLKSYSGNIIGQKFKFHDYLTGTGRKEQNYGKLPPLKPEVLKHIQDGLIKALKESIINT